MGNEYRAKTPEDIVYNVLELIYDRKRKSYRILIYFFGTQFTII